MISYSKSMNVVSPITPPGRHPYCIHFIALRTNLSMNIRKLTSRHYIRLQIRQGFVDDEVTLRDKYSFTEF